MARREVRRQYDQISALTRPTRSSRSPTTVRRLDRGTLTFPASGRVRQDSVTRSGADNGRVFRPDRRGLKTRAPNENQSQARLGLELAGLLDPGRRPTLSPNYSRCFRAILCRMEARIVAVQETHHDVRGHLFLRHCGGCRRRHVRSAATRNAGPRREKTSTDTSPLGEATAVLWWSLSATWSSRRKGHEPGDIAVHTNRCSTRSKRWGGGFEKVKGCDDKSLKERRPQRLKDYTG